MRSLSGRVGSGPIGSGPIGSVIIGSGASRIAFFGFASNSFVFSCSCSSSALHLESSSSLSFVISSTFRFRDSLSFVISSRSRFKSLIFLLISVISPFRTAIFRPQYTSSLSSNHSTTLGFSSASIQAWRLRSLHRVQPTCLLQIRPA